MKGFILAGLFMLGGTLALAADKFWAQLTPEERAAAGLAQLSEPQQAALDALAERYARAGARHEVEAVQAEAKKEATEAVRQARAAAKLEAQAQAKAENHRQRLANAGLAARDDDEVIRTRISGDFRGWKGNTVFQLENGQTWQQIDKESRFFSKMVNPEVELVPSRLTGWKMILVSEGLWIRVKRVR